ncbi:MAG: ABC transporter ATP-binding protein, partial [Acidimicrobiia bacterium]|nr:ABC transporter ATP-binding protein [Acidimicrobiia bacterium]
MVEVHDLTVRYGRGDRAVTAVDGVSFSARAGQVTAVLGPNGAGKTSTIEVCEGLRRRTSGEVRVLGLDPAGSRRDRRTLARRVGLMLQEGGVYPSARPLDVMRQYCGIHRVSDSAAPRDLLELVGLTDRARTSWRRLSGGEKQRLSLAMALVGRPDVVADELLATVKRLAPAIPQIAELFGVEVVEGAAMPKPLRPTRPGPAKKAARPASGDGARRRAKKG